MSKSLPRGLRVNNPGNIEISKGGNPWLGEIIPSADSRFAQFKSMAYGYRAMFKLLDNYNKNYGLNTVASMINRWAPSEENYTTAYIDFVCDRMGISPTAQIDTEDRDTMVAMVSAMSRIEQGVEADPFDVNDGWNLFMK